METIKMPRGRKPAPKRASPKMKTCAKDLTRKLHQHKGQQTTWMMTLFAVHCNNKTKDPNKTYCDAMRDAQAIYTGMKKSHPDYKNMSSAQIESYVAQHMK